MPSEPLAEEFCPAVEITVEELERQVAQYAHDRRLSPEAIGALAERFVECIDPREKEALREELFRGWYGGSRNA